MYLREHREARFLTQAELAERAGLARQTVVLLEKPEGPEPRVRTVRDLAKALGIEPADLYRPPHEGE